MHLNYWVLLTLLLCLIDGCSGKFGGARGGGFGRGGGGFRGSSGARSSSIFGGKSSGSFSSRSYGGSFKSGGAARSSYRTRTIGGSSYYIPASGYKSRDTFRSSFRSSFMGGMLGYMAGRAIIHSAMMPMRINNYNYYYGRRYYSGPSDRQLCSARVNQIDNNNVPFDTAIANTNLNEQMEMSKIDKELDNSTDVGSIDAANSTEANNEFKFADLEFENGGKPEEIVWSCPTVYDRCCYMECCPLAENDDEDRSMVGYALIGLFILILITLWASNRNRSQHGPIRRN